MSHPNLISINTSTAKQVIRSHDCRPILALGFLSKKKSTSLGHTNYIIQLTCSLNKYNPHVQHKHQQMHKTILDKSLICDLEAPKEWPLNRTHSVLVMSTVKAHSIEKATFCCDIAHHTYHEAYQDKVGKRFCVAPLKRCPIVWSELAHDSTHLATKITH